MPSAVGRAMKEDVEVDLQLSHLDQVARKVDSTEVILPEDKDAKGGGTCPGGGIHIDRAAVRMLF